MRRRTIHNFGDNVRFTPRIRYSPSSEREVLDILARHANNTIRVVGAKHSWSALIACEDVVLDMRHFGNLELLPGDDGSMRLRAGAGCRIKSILRFLGSAAKSTLPSHGLITEQTIAGAISTATHGSGKHILSHYVEELRVAAYDARTGKSRVFVWTDGLPLRAARCGLGCTGVILSVVLRCVPQYLIAERITRCDSLHEALSSEQRAPLQQFYLIPHLWSFYVQQRSTPEVSIGSPTWIAILYRLYWLLAIDIGFNFFVKLLVTLRRPRLLRGFYTHIFPLLTVTNWRVIDRSDRMLVMKHELVKHMEIEMFVPDLHLSDALDFLRNVLSAYADPEFLLPDTTRKALESLGLATTLSNQAGTYHHDYPICVRKILPDDALISMTSSSTRQYYSISLITYASARSPFLQMAELLARCMTQLFAARLHWGKHIPLGSADSQQSYPGLADFRRFCQEVDPKGVFRTRYVSQILGFSSTSTPPRT